MSFIPDLYGQLFGRNHMANGSIIEFAEHGRSGGISTGQPFKFTNSLPMALKITTSGSTLYIATANPGTAQSEAKWQVIKLDNATDLTITWADGNTNFDNVATDLTSLVYS
jgi:hypothetical protein